MVVGGDGSSLASHYICLILVLDFPVGHVLPSSTPNELQIILSRIWDHMHLLWDVLFSKWDQAILQHNTKAPTFLLQAASFFGAKVCYRERET